MTKKYTEKPVANWNATDFRDYLIDRHLAVYGTEYTPPGRNWKAESGLIASLIGTKGGRNPKPRKYEPEVVRAFIDECFRTHRCTTQYPTVSFLWLYKWKTDVWARVVAEAERRAAMEARRATQEVEAEDLADWL